MRMTLPAAIGTVAALVAAASPAAAATGAAGLGGRAGAAATAPAAAPGASTCTESASGTVTNCPRPPRSSVLPAGARRAATVLKPVADPAALVDTRTWTSGGGNTFPGADVPFGMVQWSPDTLPHRSDGGGYTYGDHRLDGYSLTHLSGPGCASAGDIPILPMTGRLPGGDPSRVTTSFTNSGEVAQAGYYSARSNMPATITSQFSATLHSAIGRFTFPRTAHAHFLIKLRGSELGDSASSAEIVSNDEVAGSATSGGFCGESHGYGPQRYKVYFDIAFDHSFTAHRIIPEPGRRDPNSIFLTFNTRSDQVIRAHVAISYVSIADARANWQAEAAGWDFDQIRSAAQDSWNTLLGSIAVSGGSYARTQEFYSLLYKDFLQPNVISDTNGEYLGSDGKVQHLGAGQQGQYGNFSGWDIYHSLAQLQAMLRPQAASDMAQSLVNDYAQNGILPQWGYLNLDNYAMVGDPADAVIADYYAFGATGFDTASALTDMLRQATTVNRVRPGEALEAKYRYLPAGVRYRCCRFRDPVSALLEYDSADFALSRFAAALGDSANATMLRNRANNWINVFHDSNHLLVPRNTNGSFVPGVTPETSLYYVEGDAVEYLWDVPDNYAGLIRRLGGDHRAAAALRRYLSRPNAGGRYAFITNEFDEGEQYAPDYAGDPAAAQAAAARIRTRIYRPGPFGVSNNDDLGAESSQFIWEMLGMYPENPGTDTLVFGSPGFPRAVITLPNDNTITISAPGASARRFYVSGLTINGTADTQLYVPFSALTAGATLDWTLTRHATSWGTGRQNAPPSYGRVP
jgi:predicted alpha-1,2-mannosidase